jgi:hypothetical protein
LKKAALAVLAAAPLFGGAMIRDAATQEITRQIRKRLESLFKKKP